MTRVSIIVPTYNSAETLPRTIDSALQQTVDDIEIIIIDDASEDSTNEVIKNFADERIKYFSHEQNRGGSAARNTGLEHATGDYVAYLDADDEWLPQKLEKQITVLENKPDEWVAVHCDRQWDVSPYSKIAFALSTKLGSKKAEPPKEGGKELIKEILTLNLSTGASTLLVERETVEKIGGFDPDFPRHQDWEFLIRVLREGKLAYVDETLVIKHGTGNPPVGTYEEAKQLLFSKFDDEISDLKQQGIDVKHIQKLQLTKLYIADGQLRRGLQRIDPSELTPRELLSVLWYVPEGVYNAFFG